MYSIHEMIKLVDGYAIFSIPADVEDSILPELNSRLSEFIVRHNVPGVTFDFSNLHSTDRALYHALIELIRTGKSLGATVNVTGICAGIASTLVLMEADTEQIKAFGTLDRCLADLKNHSHRTVDTAPCPASL